MSKIKRLPDAELEIMNALWDADAPLTAAELETALPGGRHRNFTGRKNAILWQTPAAYVILQDEL